MWRNRQESHRNVTPNVTPNVTAPVTPQVTHHVTPPSPRSSSSSSSSSKSIDGVKGTVETTTSKPVDIRQTQTATTETKPEFIPRQELAKLAGDLKRQLQGKPAPAPERTAGDKPDADEPTGEQIERREQERQRQVEAAKRLAQEALDATTAPRKRSTPAPKPQPPAAPTTPPATEGARRLAAMQAGPTNGRTKAPPDWAMSEDGISLKAAELHLERLPNETFRALKQRCIEAAK